MFFPSEVEKLIVSVRGQPVIVDADVAKLYGVATKRVNEAVRNNPEKFPADYMFALTADELSDLRSKISSAKISSKSRVLPKAFTEKGLYMLALSRRLDEKRGLDAGEEHRAVEMAVAFATGRFGEGEIRRWKCA